MVLYPTSEWLSAYETALEENEQLSEAGAGWGVEFDGTLLFEITDVPIEETTLGTLPEEALDGVSDGLREQLADIPVAEAAELIDEDVRKHLPERSSTLLDQVEDHIVDGTVYTYIDLYDGGCRETEILSSRDERTVSFVLSGGHEAWKRIVSGELDPVPAVMSGELEIEGDMQQVLKYSEATQLLGEIAAGLDTTHLF
ncbi:SCP2 sterol-binding domain-containing protein [Halocatena halophila]|uniref:SCP2 sterol-binding domain-containing protein n=1 Tax=Halocatena halophila TaxID=2814576 RepID=UPI002ED56D84